LFFAKIVKSQGKVQRASIQCEKCGNSFRVVARIPILLPPGSFADWTHPTVELLFGNIRRSLEELIKEYGVERIKEMYFALTRGECQPPVIVSDSPVDRKLISEGGHRITKQAVRKHLERIDKQCAGKRSIEEQVRRVVELKPRTVVDACCGGGFFIASLLKSFQGYEKLFSFDVDYHCSKRVEGIFRHFNVVDRSLPMVADVRRMPFPSDSIELVTTRYGFSHVLGYSKAIEEIYRVLQPRGMLVATDRIQTGIEGRSPVEGFTLEELISIHRFGDIYINEENFLGSLRDAGFLIHEVQHSPSEGKVGSFLVVCTKPH